jgi:hypothetical protein
MPYVAAFIAVAVVAAIVAVLYAFGVIGFGTADPSATHHYKHALIAGAVAVASLVAASFTRPRSAA